MYDKYTAHVVPGQSNLEEVYGDGLLEMNSISLALIFICCFETWLYSKFFLLRIMLANIHMLSNKFSAYAGNHGLHSPSPISLLLGTATAGMLAVCCIPFPTELGYSWYPVPHNAARPLRSISFCVLVLFFSQWVYTQGLAWMSTSYKVVFLFLTAHFFPFVVSISLKLIYHDESEGKSD